jgi:hypothetical protein
MMGRRFHPESVANFVRLFRTLSASHLDTQVELISAARLLNS